METAQGAIAKPHHDYHSTTKLIIKEIKQASEQLLQGDVNAITVSDQLLALAPSARTRFMDVETIYAATSLDTEEEIIPPVVTPQDIKNTLERDLWRETLFTNTGNEETNQEDDLSLDQDEISSILEDNDINYEDDDVFIDTDDEETINNFLGSTNTGIVDERATSGNDFFCFPINQYR